MSSKIFCILSTAMLGFINVSSAAPIPSSPAPPTEQEETRPSPAAVQNSPDPDLERAYTERRWIGLRSKGISDCPDVNGWEKKSLLDLARQRAMEKAPVLNDYEYNYGYEDEADGETDPESPLVAVESADADLLHDLGLDRLCIYTPAEGSQVDFLPPPGLIKPQKDRLALSITSAGGLPSSHLDKTIWQALADHFRNQTGPSQTPPLFTGEPSIRLTFIDSHPDGDEIPTNLVEGSRHGFTLAHLARGLVCPSSGPCAARIATRRALSYQDFGPEEPLPPEEIDDNQSGHVGLVSELATAIIAEVLHWRKFDSDKKLILNLSLGWDGEMFAPGRADLDARKISHLEPSVQAVYNALRFARRSGVLVIAAAGNRRGGRDKTQWPLLPAAWELRRPNCFRLGFGRKPVYAVGGVDWQGLPLPNSRLGGHPRRVAYSDHSVASTRVAGTRGPDNPTEMYTGTSVSATVASSIAAVVWHLRPDLSPAQVMKLVAQSGDELPSQADFYAWKKIWPLSHLAPLAKRLSLCPAIAKACGLDGRRCRALASSPKCPSWDPKPPELRALLEGLPSSELPAGEPISENPLNKIVDIASQRWTIPQPEATPCPGCTLVPREPPATGPASDSQFYDLVLEISDKWVNENDEVTIKSATLDIDRFVDGKLQTTMSYEIPPEMLTTSPPHLRTYSLTGLGDGQPLMDCRAQIFFELGFAEDRRAGESPESILNPVIVVP